MASNFTPTGSKIGAEPSLAVEDRAVSNSTDRRYNKVVQEYMRSKLFKSSSSRGSISKSQAPSLLPEQTGSEEGSYISWECPDTPRSQRSAKSEDTWVGHNSPTPVAFNGVDLQSTGSKSVASTHSRHISPVPIALNTLDPQSAGSKSSKSSHFSPIPVVLSTEKSQSTGHKSTKSAQSVDTPSAFSVARLENSHTSEPRSIKSTRSGDNLPVFSVAKVDDSHTSEPRSTKSTRSIDSFPAFSVTDLDNSRTSEPRSTKSIHSINNLPAFSVAKLDDSRTSEPRSTKSTRFSDNSPAFPVAKLDDSHTSDPRSTKSVRSFDNLPAFSVTKLNDSQISDPKSTKSSRSKNISPLNIAINLEERYMADSKSMKSVSPKKSSGNLAVTPLESDHFLSFNSKSSSPVFVDAFQSDDPFSPQARNVVSLSFSSVHSADEVKITPKMSEKFTPSPTPPMFNERSNSQSGFPQTHFFPSPDRVVHGSPLTTFSKENDVKDDSDFSNVSFHDPMESHSFDMSREQRGTPASPRTPSIRITSVNGSSLDVLDGDKVESPRRVPSWTGEITPPKESKKLVLKQNETPLQSGLFYPPEETDTKTYTVRGRSPGGSSKGSMFYRGTPSPNWHIPDDMDINHDLSDYERSIDCQERIGWFLVIIGSLLLFASVLAILIIEVPAHQNGDQSATPDNQPFLDFMKELKDSVKGVRGIQ